MVRRKLITSVAQTAEILRVVPQPVLVGAAKIKIKYGISHVVLINLIINKELDIPTHYCICINIGGDITVI